MKTAQSIRLGAAAIVSLTIPSFTMAQDNPNAATEAETARLNAETAKINAEAALTAAKAARDKAAIENLGLPKFDNKTTLGEGGGAIETSMLATRANQAAASTIKSKVLSPNATCNPGQFVVVAQSGTFNPNLASALELQLDYLSDEIKRHLPPEPPGLSVATATAVISAVAGLAGNEVTVTGIKTEELDETMLAQAVAGQLGRCAYLPSAGAPIVNLSTNDLAQKLSTLQSDRRKASGWIGGLEKEERKNEKKTVAILQELIKDAAALEKRLQEPDTSGTTLFERAAIAEKMKDTAVTVIRVSIDKAGGTITNSKNIGTFFGGDPVRVSGGLVASWTAMNLATGYTQSSGTIACQTAQVRLKKVQSGDWSTGGQGKQTALCKV